MSQNYSLQKRMSIIADLYQILRKNREQIKNLISENEALENRIENLICGVPFYANNSDSEEAS